MRARFLPGSTSTRLAVHWCFSFWLLLAGGSIQAAASEAGEAVSPEAAARGVLERLIPEHADHFFLEVIPRENERDVFEIDSRDGKIVLRGSNGVSICSALNWYLKYSCQAHVSWSGSQLELPDPLPLVNRKMRRVSPHRYRYFFNYCCFGYSLAWWDWEQWERVIDWMALNGINMPLAVTGQESTWQTVMRELGMDDEDVREFLAGPPYLPFGWMGCLDGWGGPLPQSWIDRHRDLQKRILARERSLGMTPVMQGFTGHIPPAVKEKYPDAKLHEIHWIDWDTSFLDPLDPLFQEVGKAFLDAQEREFGTDHLYAADTFIEMSPPSNDPTFLTNMGKALYGTLTAADPEAIWVMQGWIFFNNAKFWQPPQAKAFLGGVPDDGMILLDLFCDVAPVWKKTEAFHGKPWIWCILQNFGNTVQLSGPLAGVNRDLHAARRSPDRGQLSGIGMIQEGLGYNPVVFDFMTEMTWRDSEVDLDKWVRDYARRRYGNQHTKAEQAWKLLSESVYAASSRGPSKLWARPALPAKDAALAVALPEGRGQLGRAWAMLIDSSDELGATDPFRFDLVNITRQALSDLTGPLHNRMVNAYHDKDAEEFEAASNAYLQLLRDLDALLATREEFLLGAWLEDAKRWGNNAEEKRIYEWNARTVITLWGDRESGLHDYARKEWSGLVGGFYLPRWEKFIGRLKRSLADGQAFDADAFTKDIKLWEEKWVQGNEVYPPEPGGDSVAVARRLHTKYGPLYEGFSASDGSGE